MHHSDLFTNDINVNIPSISCSMKLFTLDSVIWSPVNSPITLSTSSIKRIAGWCSFAWKTDNIILLYHVIYKHRPMACELCCVLFWQCLKEMTPIHKK